MDEFIPPFEAAIVELRKRVAADPGLAESIKSAALEDLVSPKPYEFAKLKSALKLVNDKDQDPQGA